MLRGQENLLGDRFDEDVVDFHESLGGCLAWMYDQCRIGRARLSNVFSSCEAQISVPNLAKLYRIMSAAKTNCPKKRHCQGYEETGNESAEGESKWNGKLVGRNTLGAVKEAVTTLASAFGICAVLSSRVMRQFVNKNGPMML